MIHILYTVKPARFPDHLCLEPTKTSFRPKSKAQQAWRIKVEKVHEKVSNLVYCLFLIIVVCQQIINSLASLESLLHFNQQFDAADDNLALFDLRGANPVQIRYVEHAVRALSVHTPRPATL